MIDIYITGKGNSGTTFVVDFIANLGFDTGLGRQSMRISNPRQGSELSFLASIIRDMNTDFSIDRLNHFPYENVYDSQGLEKIRSRTIHRLGNAARKHGGFPELVKCPEEGQAIILDYIAPKQTIVVMREPGPWHDSIQRSNPEGFPSNRLPRYLKENAMYLDLGRLFYYLTKYDLSFTTLEYPRVAEDVLYAWTIIAPIVNSFKKVEFSEFKIEYDKTVKKEWIT